MADEPISTQDFLIEVRQARRTFQAFEHGEKLAEYALTVEQKVRDGESRLAAIDVEAEVKLKQVADRITTGEERAETAERRAAALEKQIKERQQAADAALAKTTTQASDRVADAQKKVEAAKKELAALQKKIDDLKKANPNL